MPPRSLRATPEQWEKVGEMVMSRRLDMGLSIAQLATKDGAPSARTISSIEGNQATAYSLGSIRGLSKALGWGERGLELVLDGGLPPEPELGSDAPAWATEIVTLLRELLVEVRASGGGRTE